ncbi:hypothetical protein BDZ90DRAFT_233616 [Jaminaea rosea]|uniref:L-ornithine N(5)-monooxygenase n=1 Tax=Jaminaea rosea TaxID=1569628 RepID=A0A316ULA0_9BASI|nr:hypothetical protein BDZ90DRAFT_233616 [Jaminaea rosea]PWN26019.1 hypothetical protein BDZ90DRAFT_233616 [Jaminaea rosea]
MAPPKNLPAHRRTPALFSYPVPPASLSSTRSPPARTTHDQEDPLPSSSFFDLVIIGAGPAALAVVTRILETRPAALYTEEEHHHLHWLRKKGGDDGLSRRGPQRLGVIKTKASGRGAERVAAGRKMVGASGEGDSTCACPGEMRILVIDKVGKGWMAHWDRMFAALEIKHLRSPLFFHPCPADLDSLLAYAERVGRLKKANAAYSTAPVDALKKAVAAAANVAANGSTASKKRSPASSTSSNSPPPSSTGTSSCKHPNGRGRDRQVKRLGCCADLDGDGDEDQEGDGAKTPTPRQHDLSGEPDLVEIPGVVGAEQSKHKKRQRNGGAGRIIGLTSTAINERERKDYFTPSTRLFHDFISEDVVRRYGLNDSREWPAAGKVLRVDGEDGEGGDAMASAGTTPLVVKGEVASMQWRDELLVQGWDAPLEGFLLETGDGAKVGAKAVVSAVGPAGQPSIPAALKGQTSAAKATKTAPAPRNSGQAAGISAPSPPPVGATPPGLYGPGWCHSAALATRPFPRPFTRDPSGKKTLLIVGGGLTSAQVADVALKHGHFDRVVLIMRGHLKVKPFDVGLDWMGRYSNLRKMQFWQEEDIAARLAMLRGARQGGSMTQPYAKLMKKYEQEGKVELLTHTELSEAYYSEAGQMWDLQLKRSAPLDKRERARQAYEEAKRDAEEAAKKALEAAERLEEGEADGCDCEDGEKEEVKPTSALPPGVTLRRLNASYIITASAFTPDYAQLPFMRSVAEQHPVRQEGGLPVLTEDLQYGRLPLFVVGMYCGLQIGPAAGNLGGMREAADRVVGRLSELIAPPHKDGETTEAAPTQPVVTHSHDGEEEEEVDVHDSPRPPGFTHFSFGALAIEG